jgi:hypothetical protein
MFTAACWKKVGSVCQINFCISILLFVLFLYFLTVLNALSAAINDTILYTSLVGGLKWQKS